MISDISRATKPAERCLAGQDSAGATLKGPGSDSPHDRCVVGVVPEHRNPLIRWGERKLYNVLELSRIGVLRLASGPKSRSLRIRLTTCIRRTNAFVQWQLSAKAVDCIGPLMGSLKAKWFRTSAPPVPEFEALDAWRA